MRRQFGKISVQSKVQVKQLVIYPAKCCQSIQIQQLCALGVKEIKLVFSGMVLKTRGRNLHTYHVYHAQNLNIDTNEGVSNPWAFARVLILQSSLASEVIRCYRIHHQDVFSQRKWLQPSETQVYLMIDASHQSTKGNVQQANLFYYANTKATTFYLKLHRPYIDLYLFEK